jgi:hypothetical protein
VPILPPAGLAQEAEGRRDATVVVVVCDIRKLTGVIETEPSSGEALQSLVPVRCYRGGIARALTGSALASHPISGG